MVGSLAATSSCSRKYSEADGAIFLKPTIKRVVFLIRSLNYGGSEMQLTLLANGLAHSGYAVTLLTFYPGGPLLELLSPGVVVRSLQKRSRWHIWGFLASLFRVLDEEQADVLYTFLPVANLIACLPKLRTRKLKLSWGVRASDVDLAHYDWFSRLTYWLERRLSRCPDLIISNSAAGRHYAVSQGFPDNDRFIVIPNGIDIQRFQPDARLRMEMRNELNVSQDEALVGIVARLDPMKDYPNFLRAAAELARIDGKLRFVSVGAGSPDVVAALQEQARDLGLNQRMIWAGPRRDLPSVYNALDLLVSSSAFGEGFSNVLGEAMACGVPCVATDVGDARDILGDFGVVVQRGDSDALARGATSLLERAHREGTSLSAQVRKRVVENYSVEKLVQRTRMALEAIS